MNEYEGVKNFDELLDKKHGNVGTDRRSEFEENTHMFIISEMLKEARKKANLPQEESAEKAGTKKVLYQN